MISESIRCFSSMFLCCTLMLLQRSSVVESDAISATFQSVSPLNHLAINNLTGTVYVGAVNKLFQRSENLEFESEYVTGPTRDNILCYSEYSLNTNTCKSSSNGVVSMVDTQNQNQILAVDVQHNQLVVCGTVHHGSCSIHNLTDVSVQSSPDVCCIGSNDPAFPMIGIVAPAPTGENALYIATASTDKSDLDYLQVMCKSGICSLSVTSDPFKIIDVSQLDNFPLSMSLPTKVGQGYPIVYVAGFDINGYTYFLTRQATSRTGDISVSKIIQVCQQDKWYDSYVEIQITCGESNNLVQAGIFIQPGSLWANKLGIQVDEYVMFGIFSPSASSASASNSICFYPLREIRRKITENIQLCYNGNTSYAYYYEDGTSEKCYPSGPIQYTVQISESFCGSGSIVYSPLNGTIPLVGTQFNLNMTQATLTAIQGTTVNNHTVLFLGTVDGQLLKAVITDDGVQQYDSIRFDSNVTSNDDKSVNQDLVFNRAMTHVYVMTKYKVYKVRLSECEKFPNCSACLSSRDPYCGWCLLESRCSSRMDCRNNDLPGRWVFPPVLGNTSNCPVLSVTPNNIDINSLTPIIFNFRDLPPPKSDEFYSCFFGSNAASSKADYAANQLRCQPPKNSVISVVRNQTINLSLGISSSNVSFISIPFILYNCSSFTVCSLCTGAPWNCHWCISSNACQYQDVSCNYRVNPGSSDSCPRVLPEGGEVLISSGNTQGIFISVANLPSLVSAGADNFKCKINLDVPISLTASRLNDTQILCRSYQYQSMKMHPTIAALSVVWGNSEYPIEGNYGVTVYNCSAMSENDCSICLSFVSGNNAKFNCLWCNGICQPGNNCTTPSQSCPVPYITGISPSRVPKDGGSSVTISGTNLGSNFSQVEVVVNGISAAGIEDSYLTSRQYVFVTNPVMTPGPANVTISVTSGSKPLSLMRSITVTDPKLSGMTPLFGPEAGGTLVTISGKDLQSGSTITVELGNTSCLYDGRSNDTQILCLTSAQSNPQKLSGISTTVLPRSAAQTSASTVVQFDSAFRTLDQAFEFTADPVINQIITPDGSFESGGCKITVTGSNLDKSLGCVVTAANEFVTVFSRNSSHLVFISPAISSDTLKSVLPKMVTFQLDAITFTTNFLVYPDPFLYPLNSSTDTYTTGSTLYLKGLRLNTSCMSQEVVIMIGSKICQIIDRTPDALYCRVPSLSSGDVPNVVVTAGQNLVINLGRLRFQAQIPWAIAVGVIGGISLVIIIVVVAVFIIKRVESKRRLNKLKQQLELLERNVREQCRLAFSELQTEVSDFNSDLEKHGIPFWDFKTYAFRLLFPKVHNHPVLTIDRSSKNKFGGFNEQMQQFNQLLSSQVFIVTFINVLDKQLKAFSVNDRAKVSSLLGVILLNRMEFATDVIKELLGDLIKRSVEKKTTRLMLRSTESLVEKLLANWLSLSMFEYLRDSSAGNALFMLCKALKHQMEKAPIDAVTAEAKNTLSEDRLLRESIDATVLNLTIHEESKTVTCKMLSSDSVSQAKEKALDALYRNIPYSNRPSLYDVNLAWKTGTGTFLTLFDDDSSSIEVEGWKRINTLEHYKIPPEGASFLLSGRSETEEERMETVNEYMSEQFGCTVKSETDSASIWHLVKHEDIQNSKAPKIISEIFLTRLLSTKMIMDKYIKDLFEAIFQVDSSLPPVIKYLYDFLDEAALKRGITDDDVVHAWKSNSLLLRFWVNVITNPAFVFDISKSNVAGSCLAVVAQAFIDSCSTQELSLGKDSPSTKLLFAKDIPGYRKLVQQFFTGIRSLPPVSDGDMANEMVALSKRNKTDFNLEMALRDLYSYANKFQYELMVALSNNPSAKRMHLLEKFLDIQKIMNPE